MDKCPLAVEPKYGALQGQFDALCKAILGNNGLTGFPMESLMLTVKSIGLSEGCLLIPIDRSLLEDRAFGAPCEALYRAIIEEGVALDGLVEQTASVHCQHVNHRGLPIYTLCLPVMHRPTAFYPTWLVLYRAHRPFSEDELMIMQMALGKVYQNLAMQVNLMP